MVKVGLGIDGGASSARWLLISETGKTLGSGVTPSITGHVYDDSNENLGRLRHLLLDVLKIQKPDAVVAGIAGLHKNTQSHTYIKNVLRSLLELRSSHIDLDNDMHIAYASAFKPGEGLLIYAGTGSVSYHETKTGNIARVGGHGHFIDDSGSGYWIGREGLKQTMRWVDEGTAEDHQLAISIFDYLETDAWSDILKIIYAGGRQQVAALAPAVADAARKRDPAAIGILKSAGKELARFADILFERLGPMPIAFAGGVSKLSPILTLSLQQNLPKTSLFQVIKKEPVEAAAELAIQLAKKQSKR